MPLTCHRTPVAHFFYFLPGVIAGLIVCFLSLPAISQSSTLQQIAETKQQIEGLSAQQLKLQQKLENLKLQKIREDLAQIGLPAMMPGETLIQHQAMALVYDETHEMAKWVAHIILPDIISGSVFRSNDFREDTLIKTGSAGEQDYYQKKMRPDSSWDYDGYGYDRGHLAPSADFRWSATALSESYLYSNMSPQLPAFNREIWSSLEDQIRSYLYNKPNTQLYVVTGPLLSTGLKKLERGPNKVSIPEAFWKVVLDQHNQNAIAFLIPNRASNEPLKKFALSIDSLEGLTGINFFEQLPLTMQVKLEKSLAPDDWLPEIKSGNVTPIDATTLPRQHINTSQARGFMNQSYTINVCGKVVGARLSKAGNMLINLDRQFPNTAFTVFIRKEHILNFSYDPLKVLPGATICVKGRVIGLGDTPAMYVENGKAISFYEEMED